MSFEFTFSDDEGDDFGIKRDHTVTQSSSKLHAKDEDLIIDSGEFDPIRTEMFQRTEKIADVTEYTDVIHGLYEGGLKLWECSDDLLDYLRSKTLSEDFIGKRVIDLGCGHGHPGIWCLTRGASLACFQDLNVDVLSMTTTPNLLKICGAGPIIKKKPLSEQSTTATTTATSSSQDDSVNQSDSTNDQITTNELARLELLVKNNINTGASSSLKQSTKKSKKSNSSHDLLEYERIKALVLSGEEKDPEMLGWLLEIEEEMALENEGNDLEEAEDIKDLPITTTASQPPSRLKVIQNQGYSLPHQNASLQPHATLIYGPWGDAALERSMLLSNVHTIQPCTDLRSSPAQPLGVAARIDPFSLQYPIFNFEVPREITQKNKITTVDQNVLFTTLFSSVATHFASPQVQNTPFQCALSIDLNDEFTFMTSDVNNIFSSLSLDDTTTTLPTEKASIFLQITPALITMEITSGASITSLTLLLTFLISFVEVFNATYTYYLSSLTSLDTKNPSELLKAPLPEPLQPLTPAEQKKMDKYQKPSDAYALPTYSAPSNYCFTTILSTTTSSQYYNVLCQLGLVETTWIKPNDDDHLVEDVVTTSTVVSTAALEKDGEKKEVIPTTITTSLSIPQFSKITTTFARPFMVSQEAVPTTFEKMIKDQLLPLFTSATTLPSALGFISTQRQLFYGSHPLHSPFRYSTILSSDTIYSCPTMPIFIQSIRSLLHYDGRALIGAKRYYFGVGGSTAEFSRLINEHCPDLKIRQVELIMDGASNIREILEITWNHDVVGAMW